MTSPLTRQPDVKYKVILHTLITWPLATRWTLLCATLQCIVNLYTFYIYYGHVMFWCLKVVLVAYVSDFVPWKNTSKLAWSFCWLTKGLSRKYYWGRGVGLFDFCWWNLSAFLRGPAKSGCPFWGFVKSRYSPQNILKSLPHMCSMALFKPFQFFICIWRNLDTPSEDWQNLGPLPMNGKMWVSPLKVSTPVMLTEQSLFRFSFSLVPP